VAAIAIAGMHRIWLEQNDRTFERKITNLIQLVALAEADLAQWKLARAKVGATAVCPREE
jgi:hypothetical protein